MIGNVALATLAGGPFGSWYYFGPRELGQMVRIKSLCPKSCIRNLLSFRFVAGEPNHFVVYPCINSVTRFCCLWVSDCHSSWTPEVALEHRSTECCRGWTTYVSFHVSLAVRLTHIWCSSYSSLPRHVRILLRWVHWESCGIFQQVRFNVYSLHALNSKMLHRYAYIEIGTGRQKP